MLRINYGCGWHAPDGWTNFDASPTLRLERIPLAGRFVRRNAEPFPRNVRYGNIVRGLPVDDQSCDLLYCSHVLEHLSFQDFDHAIDNSFRILRHGGVWRLVLPDLKAQAEAYVASGGPSAAEGFMRDTGLGVETRPSGAVGRIADVLGNSRHLWMWDYEAVASRLTDAGFVGVRRAEYGDSTISDFAAVEQEERWHGHLGIECRVER